MHSDKTRVRGRTVVAVVVSVVTIHGWAGFYGGSSRISHAQSEVRKIERNKSVPPANAARLSTVVTFNDHIAPIIFKNCTTCHQPHGGAPFDLLSYDNVRKRGKQIAEVITRRYMPPYLPAPGYEPFARERRLTDQQIATFKRWVATGASEGDAARRPVPPQFQSDWPLGKPDLIVRMLEAYTLPAEG